MAFSKRKPNDLRRDIRNLPNILSMIRIAVIPIILILMSWDYPWLNYAAACLYAIGAITDGIDGYLARKLNKTTPIGKLLDPLADKLLVVTSLIMLIELGRLSAFIVVIILCRDFLITGIRGIASVEGIIIVASKWGKLKTLLFNFGIIALIIGDNCSLYSFSFRSIGLVLLFCGMFFSLWSGYLYIKEFVEISLKDKSVALKPGFDSPRNSQNTP